MMNRQTLILWILVIVTVMISGCSDTNTEGNKWKLLWSDNQESEYYDKNSIKTLPGGVVQVWLKISITEKERKDYIDYLKGLNRPVGGYDKWSYVRSLIEFDCNSRTITRLSTIDYDNGENRLSKENEEVIREVVPHSNELILYKEFCSK
jgi:hypothetical protein